MRGRREKKERRTGEGKERYRASEGASGRTKERRRERERESRANESKDDGDDDHDEDDEEGEPEVGGRASVRRLAKLPNYFSSCPRGPGKIIIKTSRGAG